MHAPRPSTSRVIRLREDVNWRKVNDEVVVLDLASSLYFAVNDVGTLLWPSIVAGARSEDLVDVVVSRCGVEADRARADVEAFLATLRAEGLLTADDDHEG